MSDNTTPTFPYRAVVTLSLCFFINIYTVSSVFPYLAYYVVEAGAARDVDAAGYWSGVITASFMVGRIAAAYPLGRASDHFGRKPVLLFGLVMNAGFALIFGSLKTIAGACICRLLAGLCNGIPVVARTAATEVCAP